MLKKNSRYYHFDDNDTLIEFKVNRIQNAELCSIEYTKGPNTGEVKKMKINEVLEDNRHLTPDGYLSFSIVQVGKIKDILVTVSTQKGIDVGEKLPFAVCRQCAVDLFAKQLSGGKEDCVGISISTASCPADVEYDKFFTCDGVYENEVVEYYIGDDIYTLVKRLKYLKKYDEVLQELFDDHCMYLANNNKFIANSFKQREEVDGYCKTLQSLLELNNFTYDVSTAFGIIPTDFEPKHFESGVLSQEALDTLSKILAVQLYKTLVIKYDRDIDLNKIQRKYTLVSDCEGTIYLVAYITAGNYHVSLEDESEENIENLNTLLHSDSTRLAYNHLQFKKEKYK